MWKRKIARRLASLGSDCTISYSVKVNNDGIIDFKTYDEVVSYLAEYRSHTAIFNLQLYRVEIYSL